MKEVKQELYEVILKLWPLVYGEPNSDDSTAVEGPGTLPVPPPPPPPGTK